MHYWEPMGDGYTHELKHQTIQIILQITAEIPRTINELLSSFLTQILQVWDS